MVYLVAPLLKQWAEHMTESLHFVHFVMKDLLSSVNSKSSVKYVNIKFANQTHNRQKYYILFPRNTLRAI